MKITMTARISGTRNGVRWPEPGETIDLPEDEAITLLNLGHAEPAGSGKEAASAAPAETAAEKPARARKS